MSTVNDVTGKKVNGVQSGSGKTSGSQKTETKTVFTNTNDNVDSFTVSSSPMSAEDKLKETENKIKQKEIEYETKKMELDRAQKEYDKLNKSLQTADEFASENTKSRLIDLSNKISNLSSELENIQKILTSYQKQYDEYSEAVNSQSNSTNGADATKTTYSSNIVAKNFDGYNSAKGNKLVEAAKSLYGNVHTVNGMCAKGVSEAMQKAFGVYPGKNGNDYCDWLASSPNWKEVDVAYEDLKNLPAGAIVTWKSYGSGASVQYGHVYISDGQGGQLCDRYDVPNGKDYNAYRLNTSHGNYSNGKPYRVFIPV